jgi:hypothetical protein
MGSYRTLAWTRVDGSEEEGGGERKTGTYLEEPPTPESIDGVSQRRRLTRGRSRGLAVTRSNPRICREELGSARERARQAVLRVRATRDR